jgi:hypothetical protein
MAITGLVAGALILFGIQATGRSLETATADTPDALDGTGRPGGDEAEHGAAAATEGAERRPLGVH